MRIGWVLLCCSALAWGEERDEFFAAWLPPTTHGYVDVDVAGILAALDGHPLEQLAGTPEMAAFTDELFGDVARWQRDLVRYVPRIAAALTADEKAAVALELAPEGVEILRRADPFDRRGIAAPGLHSTYRYRGVVVRQVEELDDEGPWFEASSGTTELMAESRDLLENVIDRKLDGGASLAEREAFAGSRAALGAAPHATAWFAAELWKRELGFAGIPVLFQLGLDTVQSVRADLRLVPGGVRADALLFAPGAARGVFGLFPGRRAAAPSPSTPAGADLAFVLDLDVAATAPKIIDLIDGFVPGTKQNARDAYDAYRRRTGIDVDRDILPVLGPTLTFAVPGGGPELDPRAPPDRIGFAAMAHHCVLIGTRDTARAGALVRKLLDAGLWNAAPHVAGMRAYQATPQHQVVQLPDALAFATRDVLADVATGVVAGGGGLRATEAYRRATASLPQRRFLLLFSNPHADGARSVWRTLYERERAAGNLPPPLSLLPDAAFFLRYQDASALALGFEEAGLRMSAHLGLRAPE